MKALSRFIVKIADLAEAEGRVLRREAIGIGIVFALALGAVLLGVAAAVMIMLAVYMGLRTQVGAPWAAGISGMLLLASAGGLGWLVKAKLAR